MPYSGCNSDSRNEAKGYAEMTKDWLYTFTSGERVGETVGTGVTVEVTVGAAAADAVAEG